MTALSGEEKQVLLEQARLMIATELKGGGAAKRPEIISANLMEKRGCFVTLHKQKDLRGCIGTIEPITPLLDCVRENAFNAAFRDPRFPEVKEKELPEIDIEISVLTVPQTLMFEDGEDLKNKLKPGIHGVIISRGIQRATFLPQVWEQLPDKEAFLDHLSQKGGMPKKSWREKGTTIQVYEVTYFSEEG